jgi:Bacterial membrane protein YfhO
MNWAMAAPSIGLPTANGNDPFALTRLMRIRLSFAKGERWGSYYEVEDLKSPLLGMINDRLLISRRAVSVDGSPFVPAADLPGYFLYENPKAQPRFWLVSRLLSAYSEEDAAAKIRSSDFEPGKVAVAEDLTGQTFESPDGPSGSVRVTQYGMNQVRLQVDTPGPQYLATSEVNYPGWKAYVDGRETPIYYTNVAFRGLLIPAGSHIVEMRFIPASLWWPGAISLAGWLLWGFLWGLKSRGKAMTPGQN